MKINYDDNEYSWDIGIFREVDLNRSYWDSISYFKNYNVKERIIKTINFLTKDSENIFDHKINEKYSKSTTMETFQNRNNQNRTQKQLLEYFQDKDKDVHQEVLDLISSSLSEDSDEQDKIDALTRVKNYLLNTNTLYSKIYDKIEDSVESATPKDFKLEEYKTVNKLNNQANKIQDVNVLDMLSLDYIFKNFNKKFTLIILELVDLAGRRCDLDCNDYERPIIGKYIFYSKEILKILTEERMFYVGLLLIFVAILINFINMSKSIYLSVCFFIILFYTKNG